MSHCKVLASAAKWKETAGFFLLVSKIICEIDKKNKVSLLKKITLLAFRVYKILLLSISTHLL